jgi:hypothetical protein
MMDSLSNGGHRFEVTQDIIDEYERDGAVMLHQPFGPGGVDAVAETVMNIFKKYDEGTYLGDIYSQDGRFEITGAVGHEAVVRNWVLESQAAEIAAKVIGSKTVRLYTGLDICFGKRGTADNAKIGATSFHIDGSAWGFLGTQIPSFWTALVDVGMEAGPLVAAAGSHKKMDKLILPSPADPDEEVPDGYAPYKAMQDFLEKNDFKMKVFPAKKGDVVVINPLVVHGSLPMKGAGFRVALSTRWLGDDARWHIAPKHQAVSRSALDFPEGAPPPDDIYPIIWDETRGNVSNLPGVHERHTLQERSGKMIYTEKARVETQDFVKI